MGASDKARNAADKAKGKAKEAAGKATNNLREGFYGHDKLRFNITRSDIAAFTATHVTKSRYIRAAPAISNGHTSERHLVGCNTKHPGVVRTCL